MGSTTAPALLPAPSATHAVIHAVPEVEVLSRAVSLSGGIALDALGARLRGGGEVFHDGVGSRMDSITPHHAHLIVRPFLDAVRLASLLNLQKAHARLLSDCDHDTAMLTRLARDVAHLGLLVFFRILERPAGM